jgi:magnesium transporter
MLYLTTVAIFALYMIFIAAPVHGKTNPLIYISICASVGSVAVMAVKAVGIAVRLTFAGSNQFIYPSTYIFSIVLVVCLLTQTAYVNKAMNHFPTSLLVFHSHFRIHTYIMCECRVNALYYVAFTTCTLSASFILFGSMNASDAVNAMPLLGGFLAMLAGVYLLTMFRPDTKGKTLSGDHARNYSSIDDLIRGSQRQILVPWRGHRHSVSSIGSRGVDHEGLLGASGEGGSEVELTSLNEHGKMMERTSADVIDDELRAL